MAGEVEAEVQETGAESQAAGGSGDAGSDDRSASWADVDQAIGKMGAGEEVEVPGHRFAQGEEDEPTEPKSEKATPEPTDDKDETGPEAGEGADETPTSEEEGAESKAEEGEGEARAEPKTYTIISAQGDEYEFDEWPEGATVRFKADGKDVEATFDELVAHASMGVHAQAKLSQLGEDRKNAIDYASELEQELDRSEAILRQVLVDDEAREKVRKAAGKYLDPDYAEAARAKAELDELRQSEARDEKEKALSAFFEGVQARVGDQLSEYEFLEEEDVEPILTDFRTRFERQRDELYARGDSWAEEKKLDRAEVRRALMPQALQWLTEENLAAVMQEHNDRIAKRVAPRLRGHDERRAREHNDKTDTKRKRSRGARPLKGGGAPAQPGGGGAEQVQEGETAWEAAKRRMSSELHAARSPLAE